MNILKSPVNNLAFIFALNKAFSRLWWETNLLCLTVFEDGTRMLCSRLNLIISEIPLQHNYLSISK